MTNVVERREKSFFFLEHETWKWASEGGGGRWIRKVGVEDHGKWSGESWVFLSWQEEILISSSLDVSCWTNVCTRWSQLWGRDRRGDDIDNCEILRDQEKRKRFCVKSSRLEGRKIFFTYGSPSVFVIILTSLGEGSLLRNEEPGSFSRENGKDREIKVQSETCSVRVVSSSTLMKEGRNRVVV